MNRASLIDQFIEDVAPRLPVPVSRLGRIEDELRDHLESAAAALRASGTPAGEAEAEAVRRIGDMDQIAAAFNAAPADSGRWTADALPQVAALVMVNITAITLVVRSLPDPSASPVLAKFAMVCALLVGSMVMLIRPYSQACTVSAAMLAATGVAVLSLFAEHGETWPQFGTCFVFIAGLLVLQGGIGVFGRPRNPLNTRS